MGESLFAPGPADPRWRDIIESRPWLAPAIAGVFSEEAAEPGVCELADGMAHRLDPHRADQLRCAGNGVVPLQAACAFVELVRRSGVDFE